MATFSECLPLAKIIRTQVLQQSAHLLSSPQILTLTNFRAHGLEHLKASQQNVKVSVMRDADHDLELYRRTNTVVRFRLVEGDC